MKKIISALLAIMMLGQTAFAANLKDFVATAFPSAITDGKFDWTTFSGNVIETEATTTVRVHNEGTYADHSTVVLTSGNASKTAFDYKADLDMSNVRSAFDTLYDLTIAALQHDAALEAQFKNSKVTGEFIVEVAYDAGLSLDPATVFDLKQNGTTTSNFVLTSSNTTANPATFTFNMADATVELLHTNKNSWFADLSMEVANVTATPGANRSLTVSMTSAYTILNDATDTPADYAKISFSTPTPAPATATAIVFVPTASSGGGGSSVTAPKAYTVVEDIQNPVEVKKEAGKYYVYVDEIEKPSKEGYVFDGWYLDVGYTNPVSGTIQIKRTTYLYGRYIPVDSTAPKAFTVVEGTISQTTVKSEEDGTFTVDIDGLPTPEKPGFVFNGWYLDPYYTEPTSGILSIIEDTYIYAQFINISSPSHLISDEHILYIVGYPDGEVKPNGLITREEVAAAFYRLLKPEYRATIETTTHSFPDVASTRWSNEEIATLANGGYIVGDEKGNFNPSKPITRAEFVTIATKFADITEISETNVFSDITGHWAEEYILRATNDQHWISGYEDHTFRPNNSITRAEAMTIINKMLVRYGDVASEHATQWPDVSKTDWFYSNVIEATTEHNFTRKADGWNETWTFGTGVDDEVVDSVSGSHITE